MSCPAAILLIASMTVGVAEDGPGPALISAERAAAVPATARRAEGGPTFGGLGLRGPYGRGRIPVVLIHGMGHTPASWRAMIEALEADRRLAAACQFWTFAYDSGGPILYSAAMLRRDLRRARRAFDPEETDRAFDRMVLIGHSMGGLLARLMAQGSGESVWPLISDRPFERLAGPPDARELLREMAFFEPEGAVRRLVLIATPHRGSPLGGWAMHRFTAMLFREPEPWRRAYDALVSGNAPDFFGAWFGDGRPDGIEDVTWGHPVPSALARLPIDPSVKVHSIIARFAPEPGGSHTDGLVSYRSAHLEGAASERIVAGNHFCQAHPQVIEEVGRILREHLAEAVGGPDAGAAPSPEAAAPAATGAGREPAAVVAPAAATRPDGSVPAGANS